MEQDVMGMQAYQFSKTDKGELYAKQLSNTDWYIKNK